jgi:hypothetical protein
MVGASDGRAGLRRGGQLSGHVESFFVSSKVLSALYPIVTRFFERNFPSRFSVFDLRGLVYVHGSRIQNIIPIDGLA